MMTIELAYDTHNKAFISHAACQKWIVSKIYGEITPRELSWGLFKCPDYLKVCEMKINQIYIISYFFNR